jgi:uncharacterized protein YqeY
VTSAFPEARAGIAAAGFCIDRHRKGRWAMSLQARITDDMKNAMRAKDSARLTTIRMLTAALKQKEVDERVTLTDADVLAIVDKLVKQRRDSVAAFEKAERRDLVDKEKAEIEILSAYLPKALTEAEITEEIAQAITQLGVSGPQAMGKVMADLKPRLAGRADMTRVSALVKAALAG